MEATRDRVAFSLGLTGRTDPEKLQLVGHLCEPVAARDFIIQTRHRTFVQLDYFRAPRAHQMMMVRVVARGDQFEAPDTVPPIEPLDYPQGSEQMQRPIDRGQIADTLVEGRENVLGAHGMASPTKDAKDRLPGTGDAPRMATQLLSRVR
jgi:hypothetical protein